MADQQALHAFSQWVAGCSGDERQEAEIFVQKLLTAWGWEDACFAGVGFEHLIPKGGAGGGMGFAARCIAVTATTKKQRISLVRGVYFRPAGGLSESCSRRPQQELSHASLRSTPCCLKG
jgi:hypothetical protein